MNFKGFGTAFVVLALTACSSQPTQPAADTPAPAAATPPAATALAASPAANEKAPAVNRTLISAGYKPTTIKGEVYYCRTEMVTNTAFKKKVCLNEAQIKNEEKRIQRMQDDLLRSQTNGLCAGPTCGGD